MCSLAKKNYSSSNRWRFPSCFSFIFILFLSTIERFDAIHFISCICRTTLTRGGQPLSSKPSLKNSSVYISQIILCLSNDHFSIVGNETRIYVSCPMKSFFSSSFKTEDHCIIVI